ncbi:ABC-2 type transport system permease protein [Arthrobacter sp. V4I6]|uniref:ABC transporter permease n=1 Tax=unclassified Arthrobacter TaxID=235627 RepID=UPI002785A265|nr:MULTISPECIES: ABC transporter permease [unclassified Arthrobacter]MDQ0822517.1 ABC-2 type transport system permease protein [Arthrobacter sp. V1I7]MDQ0852144.1 ABC-2 type transport system permease protein [Arthrobacter sp. V4I6]
MTKRRFWIGTLSVPVIMAVVFGLIFLSNTTTDTASQAQSSAEFTLAYTDASGLITPEDAALFGARPAESAGADIQAVQAGTLEAYFDFPARPGTEVVRVYGADKGIFENGKYAAVAQAMLTRAVEQKVGSAELSTLATGKARIETVTYDGTQESGGLGSVIPPLVFLVIFYGLIVLLAGQMLNSTLEEKENRVTEMILTTLKPTTLIAGKVLALFAIGLVQMIVFLSPILIARLILPDQLNPAAPDLPPLIFDPVRMTIGFLILIGGFALFTTTLEAIGAVMPTAKEAGNVLGVMMALIFVPFYAVALVISDPHSVIVQIFTYFPFSAPVTALLRNGFGSLNPLEAAIVIGILFVGATVMLRLAVRLFQYGSISYTSKVSIRTALRAGSRHGPAEAAPTTPGR